MDLDQLARVYSFAQLRRAKRVAKNERTLKFLKRLERYKLDGVSKNNFEKVRM